MNTPTHFLIHLSLKKFCKDKKQILISSGFLWGAIAPDVLLYFTTIIYSLYAKVFWWMDGSEIFLYMFDYLYFHHPLWIFMYNLLHSLFLVWMFLIISIFIHNSYSKKLGFFLIWFFIWCLVHIALDVPVHHDDGPILFYPLSEYRFSSPISYWDTRHFGSYFVIFEWFLFFSLLLYIIISNFLTYLIQKKWEK